MDNNDLDSFFVWKFDNTDNVEKECVFYNSIKSDDILYNVKSFCPIEENLIKESEKRIKNELQENINKFGIYKPK